MIMSVERIEKAMVNVYLFLAGPRFVNSKEGAEYCIVRLREKGITARVHQYEYVGTEDTGWGVYFEYHGWRIFAEEEMFAENLLTGREVFCPPC